MLALFSLFMVEMVISLMNLIIGLAISNIQVLPMNPGLLLFSFFSPLLLFGPPFFQLFSEVHHPVNWDAGISFHMQWPLTSQSHGSFLKENICFFSLHMMG
jgi:hypothetical protein